MWQWIDDATYHDGMLITAVAPGQYTRGIYQRLLPCLEEEPSWKVVGGQCDGSRPGVLPAKRGIA